MKITNSKTGKSYQLTPGTQLEVERPNLFFNEWGEQTLPVDIPSSDYNEEALGYPDITSVRKLPDDIQATISSGEYFSACRQAILKVKRKKTISTSFYLNEGSFLAQISKASLREMFGEETIPGVKTVQQGIDFCRSLVANENTQFAIFPVFVDFDNSRRYINQMEFMNASGGITGYTTGKLDFYNSYSRIEEVDGISVKLDPGYYMTPFLRAPYLLRRIFSYFGYTLLENFFDVTEPFKSMVFINNTIDSLVNGSILLSHLVPDCMCNTILDVFRKKFLCEFISDEVNRTVSIEFFDDIAKMKAETDLTNCLTSPLEFDIPTYQKVVLSSETMLADGDTYDSTAAIKAKYPNAYWAPMTGSYYRVGYSDYSMQTQKISSATIPYMAGGTLKEKKITCPDAMFYLLHESRDSGNSSAARDNRTLVYLPFIGDGRSLNSTLIVNSSSDDEGDDNNQEEEIASNKDQAPMLSLVYKYTDGYCIGTNTNYTYNNVRFADYSLLYNGPDGIFERFYRTYDNLLRNSMHPVKGDILLSDHQKMNIPAHRKVIIDGQELFIDKLKYSIGGNNEPIESSFYTTRLYEPVQTAPAEDSRFPLPLDANCWSIDRNSYEISESDYNAELVKFGDTRGTNKLPYIYPPFPTKEQVAAGGYYYERSFAHYQDGRDNKRRYYRVVARLRPIKTPY